MSIKKSRKLAIVVGDLKSGRSVNFFDWSNNDIASYCKLYISLGWCKRHKSDILQYEAFQEAVRIVELKIKTILDKIIDTVPGLRRYMMIHSIFKLDDNIHGDWLVRYMIKKLCPTEQEIKEAHKKEEVPQEILNKLAMFYPSPLGFEKNCDNVKLVYEMWGNPEKGGSIYPVTIIDRGWEKLNLEREKLSEARSFISKFEVIDV